MATTNSPSPDLPPNTVEFAGGSAPNLPAGTYTINVTHTLSGVPGVTQQPSTSAQQTVIVQGPQFALDPNYVASIYPPNDGFDAYDQQLPFIAFNEPDLPWDIDLGVETTASPPPPWLALVIFAEDEIAIDAATNSPLTTCTVGEFISGTAGGAGTLPPSLTPVSSPPPGTTSTQCQVITIPASTFEDVLPSIDDLPYLAHCRSVNMPGEPQQTVSVLLCNRLPLAQPGGSPAAATRYYAHVVSLQGFAGVIGGPVPAPYTQVQLVSLYNWSFLSMPETGASFNALATNLAAGAAPLALPLDPPSPPGVPPDVVERLASGYTALDFHAFDTTTFAWYRGPFSAVAPEPLPQVGSPHVPVENATSSDALLIYLSNEGLFDASYAAAWNLGRNMALANGSYTSALLSLRNAASSSAAMIARRMAMPHLAGLPPSALLARDATRRRFLAMMGEGLGRDWDRALARGRGSAPPGLRWRRAKDARVDIDTLLAQPGMVDAIGEAVGEAIESIAGFLASLCLLEGVPFSTLVPDPRMLPIESARFFIVDTDWIDALVAGAASHGLQTSTDFALHLALWPRLSAAIERKRRKRFARPAMDFATPPASPSPATMRSGMLIRSQLISGFPTANITAQTSAGEQITVARDVTLAPSVRLLLFEAVPDVVTIAEPYHGLRFGVQDQGVMLRSLTTGNVGETTGATIPDSSGQSPSYGWNEFLSQYCPAGDGVIRIAQLAQDIVGVFNPDPFGSGDFALQLVMPPEAQSFTFGGGG